ncbi:MAG TPA: glycosyltransferase, partial [Myxococcaceae bacterium]|nr:glycosyltransferase [Myxococcaceae bacterium]
MRILLTNHHLQERAGSELYCLELSTALRQAGHQVAVFTFYPGHISEELVRRGVTVFMSEDAARIEDFDPDILHVHHAPCLYFLGALRLRAAVVFSSLGVIPALESAPVVWEGVAQGLAVSEEVREMLGQSPFAEAVPLQVFRNWFDDTGLERPAPVRPVEARRVAVVTNHLDPALKQDLDALCAAHPGLEWTHLGLPENPVEMGPAVLQGFDRVITIGRTALLAAALQKPCVLYDMYGCDGLLTAERLDVLLTRNLSGRLTRSRPSREELARLLLDEARQVDVAGLADRVWREFSLSRRVQELLALYGRVLERGVALSEKSRKAYGAVGRVYAEATQSRRHAISLLEAEQRRGSELERLLAESRHREQALSAELVEKTREAAEREALLSAERARSARLAAEYQ